MAYRLARSHFFLAYVLAQHLKGPSMEVHLNEKTDNIAGLNALRFFGASLVILLHLGSYDWFMQWELTKWHRLVSGVTGVYIFYVISGFLITCLAIDEITKTGRFNLATFLGRRALRLFPLYYLAIAVIAILSIFGVTHAEPDAFLYAITYTYNLVPKAFYNGLLGSFHTLATEEQFYILYGFLLWLSVKLLRWKSINALWIALVNCVLLAGLVWGPVLGAWAAEYLQPYKPHRIIFNAMAPLIIGCLSAFLVKTRIFYAFLKLSSKNSQILVLLHYTFLFIFAYLYVGYAVSHKSTVWLAVGVSTLLVDLYVFRASKVANFLEKPTLVYLGSISYGLYVWQAVFNGTSPMVRWIESPWLSTFLVFAVSVLSYELYEKRFLRLKRY